MEWFHGTTKKFNAWKIPSTLQKVEKIHPYHSAVFFTTDLSYATGASKGTGIIATANLVSNANILDMNNCSHDESEAFRKMAGSKNVIRRNMQVAHPGLWREGWRTGRIMKYAPSSDAEYDDLTRKNEIVSRSPKTHLAQQYEKELQRLTRDNIEGLVEAARDLNYHAVIGNEIDTLDPRGVKTFRIMFALITTCITPPSWTNTK
jgi:hypothetical protein